MANHVSSYLRFEQLNEEGTAVLQKIYDRFDKYGQSGECHLGYVFQDDISEMTIGEAGELIGAKWGYVQDYDVSGMSMYSAWRQPEEFAEYVIKQISEVNDNVIGVLTYEDEAPNFAGVSIYTSEGLVDSMELDYDEIREEIMDLHSDVKEQWDDVEEEWLDDGDLFYDYQWDFINEWQSRVTDEMVEWVKEDME